MSFLHETKRTCMAAGCGREVDAVRIVGESGLKYARHLKRIGRGFCSGSLDEVSREGAR